MGGVDLHSACGWVAAEFAVVGEWVPKVIKVLPIVRCVSGVVVHAMWVELCMCVGAPHVSRVGGLGEFGGDLLCLCGVDADEFAYAGEEVGCILEWAYAVEALARVGHGGWSKAYALLGSVGEF